MVNEKEHELEKGHKSGDPDSKDLTVPRARNRTVMLSSDITGEMRSRLAEEQNAKKDAPRAGTYSPAGSSSAKSSSTQSIPLSPPPPPMHAQEHVHPGAGKSEGIFWTKESPIIGFLVSYDVNPNGTVFEIRSGRLLVTSEPASSGSYLLVHDKSVSPLHAILNIEANGKIQLLDQLSEHGTRLKRQGSDEEESFKGEKSEVHHGDVLHFGKRSFHLCLVQSTSEIKA